MQHRALLQKIICISEETFPLSLWSVNKWSKLAGRRGSRLHGDSVPVRFTRQYIPEDSSPRCEILTSNIFVIMIILNCIGQPLSSFYAYQQPCHTKKALILCFGVVRWFYFPRIIVLDLIAIQCKFIVKEFGNFVLIPLGILYLSSKVCHISE